MAPRLLPVLVVALIAMMVGPARLRADGDPASDVLLVRNVFFLYDPPPGAALQKTLNAEIAAAGRAGFPMKVALVRAPLDLGLVPVLFGHPQKYADFLGQEISRQYAGPLLVVMPAGYGVHGVKSAATRAVAKLPRPVSGQIDDLARAAVTAVAKIAAASGHPIATPAASSGPTGGSSTIVIVAILAGAAVVAVTALLIIRRRVSGGRSS
jgi:hypothetical protein